jgi:hypothetical protein
MGRGSADHFTEDYFMVASRQGDVRGTELGKVGPVELEDREWIALKALVSLSYEHPSEAGYASEVICETAAGFATKQAAGFVYEETDGIVAALEQMSFAEQTSSVLDVDTGQLYEDKSGWRAKAAGVQFVGAFMAADWPSASISEG